MTSITDYLSENYNVFNNLYTILKPDYLPAALIGSDSGYSDITMSGETAVSVNKKIVLLRSFHYSEMDAVWKTVQDDILEILSILSLPAKYSMFITAAAGKECICGEIDYDSQ